MTYRADADVPAGLLSVDLYPLDSSCGPRPVLFWVHGGGWRTGDKRHRIDGKQQMAARHGWVLVSVNYRLTDEANDVRWPDHGDDVRDAISFVLGNANEYGIDPAAVGVMGHSAGGHLAAFTAVDPDAHRAVTDCLVVLDTEAFDLTAKMASDEGEVKGMIVAAFGTDPAVWAAASPTLLLGETRGPLADTVVVTRGSETRRRIAADFAAAVAGAGGTATVIDAGNYSHLDVNARVGDRSDEVVGAPVEDFLVSCLGA